MRHFFICIERISVRLLIIIVLLFVSSFSIGHAQRQSINDQAERVKALNAMQDANDHYYQKRYAEAIKAYQELLKTNLSQTQKDSMRLMLGQSYAKLGEDAEARKILKEIIDENPDGSYASQAVHQLSNLYSQRYQYKEAIIMCKQILKQHPDTTTAAVAAYLIAYYEYVEGNFESAMKSYKHFLDKYPNSIYRSSAISSLVRLYTQNKRFSDAEKLVQERLNLNPTDTTLLEELANIYQQQGKSQKALKLYQGVLESNPGNASIRRKLGSLYAELGDKEKAIAEWKKLVAGDYNQHQQLGMIYVSHKMYTDAIKSFQEAIRVNPSYGYLYTQLAAVYNIQGDIEKAAATYLDGLQTVGPSTSQRAAIWKSMLEIYQGERQEPLRQKLIAQYEMVHKAAPRNLNNALTLGEMYFYDGQYAEAQEILTQIHKFYAASVDSTFEKLANDLERNQNPYAIGFYKSLLQLSNDRRIITNARYKLASLYQKNKQWDEAIKILEELDRNSFSIDRKLLLARTQLHGLQAPKAAHITLQPLLSRNLAAAQLVEANLILGECHLLQKRWTLARDLLKPIANSGNRSSATARKLLGDSYFFATEFDNAVSEYQKVLQVSKSDELTNDALERIVLIQDNSDYLSIPLSDYANALQFFRIGDTKSAITQCEDTITAHPKALIVDDIWMLLGKIYRSQKSYGNAIHSYRQVVSLESSLAAEALTQIADIYQKKKDYANAADAYTTLLQTYPGNSIIPHVRQQLDEITKLINNSEDQSP